MKSVPLWVVASLGQMVTVKACSHLVKLQGIDAGQDGIPYAVVQLTADDPGDLENVNLDDLVPVRPVSFSVDLEQGTIATR